MESKWQKRCEKTRVFEVDPDGKKLFLTFPYCYVNAPPHLGQGMTSLRLDVYARFKRMQGYNVLYPFAFHLTGEPLVGAVERYKKGDKVQKRIFKDAGIPKEYLKSPIKLGKFMIKKWWIPDVKRFGISADWRRQFYTTSYNPQYNAFVEWQYRKLRKKGYVVKGTHPVIWCPKDQSPTGDHDRLVGEGVSPIEYTLLKFDYKNSKLICGTLRPETIYGVTNIWINPKEQYVKAKVGEEVWIISKEASEKLKEQLRDVKVLESFKGNKLVGEKVRNPVLNNEVLIFPAEFVDADDASGIVMSVPAHAPIDYVALQDLLKDNKTREQYKIEKSQADLKPISLISVPEYGEIPAKEEVEKLAIKDQNDPLLKKATETIYKKEFHTGVLKGNMGKYSGMKVSEVKESIIKDFEKSGIANSIWETAEDVVCRCGTKCIVKILKDQWFLKYSDPKWKKEVKEYLKSMRIVPEEARHALENTIDWLEDKACARKTGLGTPLPWDKKWIVESLSDSTIYMAFYTIANYINAGKVPKDIGDDFFDYVFLGNGNPKKIVRKGLSLKDLKNMRKEFLYWYPVDLRNSGKDLLYNHLPFFIFHHVAIFPKKHWPRGISANGFMAVEGMKMSKSKGNFITLNQALEKHGSDVTRANLAVSIKGLDDPDWREESAVRLFRKLSSLQELITKKYKFRKGTKNIDRWLLSRIQEHIHSSTTALEELDTRTSCNTAFYDIWNDVQWYLRRDSPNSILREVFRIWVKLLSPIVPFVSEEIWNKLGEKPFVCLASWPKEQKSLIKKELEREEELIKGVLRDLEKIKDVTKVSPKKIYLYAIGNDEKILRNAILFFEKETGAKVTIYNIKKPLYDPEGKAKKAKFGKPGIYIEG